MSEEIPFTTGPLQNWPLIEESMDAELAKSGAPEDFREQVLQKVQEHFAALGGGISTSLRMDLPTAAERAAFIAGASAMQEAIGPALRKKLATAIGRLLVAEIKIAAAEA
jgi:hypothetical protein